MKNTHIIKLFLLTLPAYTLTSNMLDVLDNFRRSNATIHEVQDYLKKKPQDLNQLDRTTQELPLSDFIRFIRLKPFSQDYVADADNAIIDTLKEFIRQGSDLDFSNQHGKTLFNVAENTPITRIKSLFKDLDLLRTSIKKNSPLDLSTLDNESLELFIENLINAQKLSELIKFSELYNNQLKELSPAIRTVLDFINHWKEGTLNPNQETLNAILQGPTDKFDNALEVKAYTIAKEKNYQKLGKLIRNWATQAKQLSGSSAINDDQASLIATYNN